MASDTFIDDDWDLIPPDVDILDPDEELADFADPDAIPETESPADPTALPVGRNLFFDETTGQFGDWVYGNDAVVQCAKIAMVVKRGSHIMFPDDLGRDEPERRIGRQDDAELRALSMADTKETLLTCHERITDVRDFVFLTDDTGEIAFEDVTIEIDGEAEERLEGLRL